MSYSNGTTHYNLPLTQGSDKRDWSDTNQAFEDLDAAIYQASSDATGALSAAQSAQTTANSAATDAASAVSTANAASAAAATASETASLARTEAQSAQSSASSAVTTAQSAAAQASNADTVALAAQSNIGTMSNLNTQDKTSLVAAINEVLGQIGGGMPVLNYASPLKTFTSASDSYTCNRECYLVGNAFGSGQSISINGTVICAVSSSGTNSQGKFIAPLKLKSGDIVTASTAMSPASLYILAEV